MRTMTYESPPPNAERIDVGENVEPSESDGDYKHNDSASASDTYYVQFFAVGVAFDGSSLSNAYSLVLDLGSVPIIKNK